MGWYATVADVQDHGAPSTVSEARIEEALEVASRYIDEVTRLFFEERTAKTYILDGRGTAILELPAPCLTLTSVEADDQVVDLTGIVNRNRPPEDGSGDYWWPRLEWKSSPLRMERAFGPRFRQIWPMGEQNIEVTGDFGFVVASPSASGLVTPPLIRRACIMLVARMTNDLASAAGQPPGAGNVISETIGNYSYTLASAIAAGALTGDPEIDSLLLRYTRAMTVEAV